MPVQDKNNITLGLGTIEFGAYVNDVFQAYEDVGAIKGEVTIAHQREVQDFETGRPLITIKQEVVRERVTVKVTLAELNLATIKKALGQGVLTSNITTSFLDGTQVALRGTLQTGTTSLGPGTLMQFGGLSSNDYIGLRFTHPKTGGQRIIFEGYKASPTGDLTLPFRETDWQMSDVNFRLLADTTRPAGQQYYQMFIET